MSYGRSIQNLNFVLLAQFHIVCKHDRCCQLIQCTHVYLHFAIQTEEELDDLKCHINTGLLHCLVFIICCFFFFFLSHILKAVKCFCFVCVFETLFASFIENEGRQSQNHTLSRLSRITEAAFDPSTYTFHHFLVHYQT